MTGWLTKSPGKLVHMPMPYIVGRWVRGRSHYGRERLINYLLDVQEAATWVVGTRRMGKTSLLRQLEFITDQPDSHFVPLIWDLQGCDHTGDLSKELFFALEDSADRFASLGIDIAPLADQDAVATVRRLSRSLAERNRRLLLLMDEAEVLIHIGEQDPAWLAHLRKALQEGRHHTVMTSTKLLTQLNDLAVGWKTSPFLFGFNLANLWQLDLDAALALVRQTQSDTPVAVDDGALDDIITHTNRHPYLIQYLCQRLYQVDDHGNGTLRPVDDEDLAPDHLLAGFFQIDFQHLSRIERRILLAIAEPDIVSDRQLLTAISDESPARTRTFLFGLNKLGYVRQVHGQWALGNEYLRRWVQDHFHALSCQLDSAIDDHTVEVLLQTGKQNELIYLQGELDRLQQRFAALQAHGAGAEVDASLAREIERVDDDLTRVQRELQLARNGACSGGSSGPTGR